MTVTHPPSLPSVRATSIGLVLDSDLSFEEWQAIASDFGKALQTAAWCIGDWLLYGQRKWGHQLLLPGEEFNPKVPDRIPSHAFDLAVAATGLDRQTISKYAEVCRKIPPSERRDQISFGHHRVLAPLPTEKREQWFGLLTDSESVKPSVKRLSLSIRIAADEPRIVADDEIIQRGSQAGHDNYVPHLTRLLTVLRKTLPDMDADQRRALRADTAQLRELLEKL